VLVLSWNLYHGRSVPPSGRNLYREFAEKLAGWQWDAALLQEVPPWWPPALAADCGAEAHMALTSRNLFLPLRRFVAERRPDVIKSTPSSVPRATPRRRRATSWAGRVARPRSWEETSTRARRAHQA
jgi:hypothetical protein